MGITAFCVTLLLFLPGDQLINMKDVRLKPAAAPFHMRRENTLQNPHHHPNLDADKNNNNDNLPSEILAAVASPMTVEHLAKDKVSFVLRYPVINCCTLQSISNCFLSVPPKLRSLLLLHPFNGGHGSLQNSLEHLYCC